MWQGPPSESQKSGKAEWFRQIFQRGSAHQIQSQWSINRSLTETGWPLALRPGQTSPGLLGTSCGQNKKAQMDLSPHLRPVGKRRESHLANLLGTLLPQKLTFSDATLLKAAPVPPHPHAHSLATLYPLLLPCSLFIVLITTSFMLHTTIYLFIDCLPTGMKAPSEKKPIFAAACCHLSV